MKKWIGILACILAACAAKKLPVVHTDEADVKQIIAALADDSLKGRAVFTPEIDQAANFIAGEFAKAQLKPLNGHTDFKQNFFVFSIQPSMAEIIVDGVELPATNGFVLCDQTGLKWNTEPSVAIDVIKPGENFRERYQACLASKQNTLVCVSKQFKTDFIRMKAHFDAGRILLDRKQLQQRSLVFILTDDIPQSFRINYTGLIREERLTNVVGVLPGKSRPNEYVVFSAHYDHIGVLDAVGQDSIANGADDDASGVTAVISLAKIFAKQRQNERTLIFAAFTAEESGGFGSQYFSKQLDPVKVVAMLNIEMIGKDAKFGPHSLYITGFDKSDVGQILQRNTRRTGFSFHADPYPEQNLFYRSDNATLAALGVPAHSVSTVQIDQDNYYHTVDDELETLDIKNIVSAIHAIALGARTIINGEDTPSRIVPISRSTE